MKKDTDFIFSCKLVLDFVNIDLIYFLCYDFRIYLLSLPFSGLNPSTQKVTYRLALILWQEVEGELLVGADGINSVIRSQLFGASAPRYAGYRAWRGVVKYEDRRIAPGRGLECWRQGNRCGIIPISQGRIYWFATRNAPDNKLTTNSDGYKAELLREFQKWLWPVEEIIVGTPDEAILCNNIYDRPPLREWSKGNVTLLGDAAHPMTPNFGQGACQASEDAVQLATCLKAGQEIAASLKLYERLRVARTTAIVKQSRLMGWVGQWENPYGCRARNQVFKFTPASLQLKPLEKMIGYQS
ncbi:MAG TPA: FAD-dependent monooxygenase [Chloroflexia bacterium]|nr:FAD-dependent monooxygenase [Chloroflexia bacterium]